MRLAAWITGVLTVAALAVIPADAASTAAVPAGLVAGRRLGVSRHIHNHREHHRR